MNEKTHDFDAYLQTRLDEYICETARAGKQYRNDEYLLRAESVPGALR